MISWHYDTIASPLLFLQCAMVAALILPYSTHLIAQKGGLLKKVYKDVCDNGVRLAELAWGGVTVAPVLLPQNDQTGHQSLQADWGIRGVW